MKTTALAILVLALSLVSNAHALSNYNETYTYSPSFTLNNGHQFTSFSFTGVTNPFTAGSTYPSLSLNLTGSTGFGDQLQILLPSGATTTLLTLNAAMPVFKFDSPELLNTLNSAIVNNQVTFNLLWQGRSSTLSSATLNGTMAPEPASALLVAAGLAAIPLLRRLKSAR